MTEEEKTRRIVALQALAADDSERPARGAGGPTVEVLVDAASRRRDTELSGRTSGNVVVNLPGPRSWIGRTVLVRVARAGRTVCGDRPSCRLRDRTRTDEIDIARRGAYVGCRHADRDDDQGADGRPGHEHADRHPARQARVSRCCRSGSASSRRTPSRCRSRTSRRRGR